MFSIKLEHLTASTEVEIEVVQKVKRLDSKDQVDLGNPTTALTINMHIFISLQPRLLLNQKHIL